MLHDTPAQTDPLFGIPPLTTTASPLFEFNLGRESRELPTENVGALQAPVSYIPTLESFSADGGLAHVPVLNNSKVKIASKVPKHPVLSTKSFVSVISCFNRISGLPKHLEYIHRDNLTLGVLKKILECNLEQLP